MPKNQFPELSGLLFSDWQKEKCFNCSQFLKNPTSPNQQLTTISFENSPVKSTYQLVLLLCLKLHLGFLFFQKNNSKWICFCFFKSLRCTDQSISRSSNFRNASFLRWNLVRDCVTFLRTFFCFRCFILQRKKNTKAFFC